MGTNEHDFRQATLPNEPVLMARERHATRWVELAAASREPKASPRVARLLLGYGMAETVVCFEGRYARLWYVLKARLAHVNPKVDSPDLKMKFIHLDFIWLLQVGFVRGSPTNNPCRWASPDCRKTVRSSCCCPRLIQKVKPLDCKLNSSAATMPNG